MIALIVRTWNPATENVHKSVTYERLSLISIITKVNERG